ncbi:unnamed protein product [Adineta ricciae]|uniref:Proteasome activator complex subunit 4-like HEAT repeat-like domain-containing protein n=1 Tax=Adineta ricciae TaxID=249248 RepID=A0A815C4Y9_ADIRI|nr:unnamed protein product [Adineta ricciae]
MPEQVAVIHISCRNKHFLNRMTQMMVLDEEEDLNQILYTLFKSLLRHFALTSVENFMKELYRLVRDKSNGKLEEMIDELRQQLTPFLIEVFTNLISESRHFWHRCLKNSIGNQDPRRMCRLIQFLHPLMKTKTPFNTLAETSRWSLLPNSQEFAWRVPSISCEIYERTKRLLDRSPSVVRQLIPILLALSVSYDVTRFERKSTRHPSVNQLMNN